eukprot:gnl/TRDRNA2_/TRDRNA2_183555_c0_seq1.p1 gnl/TRDRNA2_/TRDRNA2_183555_c0~~gnl/TRDRNA2_/TRDRNA2_183555_c0_seq1.p1  ORF type:complete len:324 (-),score=52.67 gnl/TRDRNA2_/TRDRNA2_183555_c0_seq1:202-1086(-)
MQFTPQQLTGGPRYQHKVRIGNWSEDLELEEIKLKDYLKKKEQGALLVNAKQVQLEESLMAQELSSTADGLLRFGDRLMLVNHQSKGYLAANPHDAVQKSHQAYILTSGPNSNACVRNVFELERADPHDGFEDDLLHYGQSFRLRLNPFSKIAVPTYMHSEMVTALAAAKFSRHQEVTAYAAPNGETLWQILYPDTQCRFEMDGEPVPAGSPCVIRHSHTGSFLASDEIPYNNIFGAEFEVHCFPYYSLNKTQNLQSEKKGEITGDYALRRHGLANIWTLVSATHAIGSGVAGG